MAAVKYIDSSGIAALVEGMQLSKSNSKEFCLTDVSNEVMKVVQLAHLDKFFKITGQDAIEGGSEPAPAPEPEQPQASENVDLTSSEEPQPATEAQSESNDTEETQPSIRSDDDGDDKIKFKR